MANSKKAALLAQLERELAHAQIRKRAVRVAARLMPEMHLQPDGIDLIAWLADCGYRTNRDVLVHWIEIQLQDAEVQFEIEHQPEDAVLMGRLCKRLALAPAANDEDGWV